MQGKFMQNDEIPLSWMSCTCHCIVTLIKAEPCTTHTITHITVNHHLTSRIIIVRRTYSFYIRQKFMFEHIKQRQTTKYGSRTWILTRDRDVRMHFHRSTTMDRSHCLSLGSICICMNWMELSPFIRLVHSVKAFFLQAYNKLRDHS